MLQKKTTKFIQLLLKVNTLQSRQHFGEPLQSLHILPIVCQSEQHAILQLWLKQTFTLLQYYLPTFNCKTPLIEGKHALCLLYQPIHLYCELCAYDPRSLCTSIYISLALDLPILVQIKFNCCSSVQFPN